MQKVAQKLILAGVLYVVLAYVAHFTARQSGVLSVILILLVVAIESLLPENKPKFQRIEFSINLTNLDKALIDTGIYTKEEIEQNRGALQEALGAYSSGRINFTWLEPKLFFMNGTGRFAEYADITIYLKPFGARALKIGNWLPDSITLQGKDYYELVLNKAEDTGPMGEEGHTLVLLKLPAEFFGSLQGPLKRGETPRSHLDRQDQMLESVGLKYWQHEEIGEIWGYKGEYVNFDWIEF